MVDNVIIGANSYIARNFIYQMINKYKCNNFLLYGKEDYQLDGFINYHKVNILEKADTNNINLDCNNIYMFVGKTGTIDSFKNYVDFININQISLLNLLDQYIKQNSKAKLIFLSTRLLYDDYKGLQKEEFNSNLKSIYAVSKFACEQYLQIYSKVFNVKYVILRLCVPYGSLIEGAESYGTCGFITKKAQNNENITIYGDGSQRRTFTYIGDIADILYRVGTNKVCINDIYNIGGESYSLNDVAMMIANYYGVNIDYIPFPEIEKKIESGDTVFDSQKLDSIIGNLHKSEIKNWIYK